MARATANCTCATCGAEFHPSTIKRNRREADDWEAWAASHYDECSDCYQKRIQAEREEANRKAAENAKAAGLPALVGSEKQISWANTLRDAVLNDLAANIQKEGGLLAKAESCEDPEKRERRIERHERIIDNLTGAHDVLLRKVKASWWIDNARLGWEGLTYSEAFTAEVAEYVKIKKATPVVDDEVVEAANAEMTVAPEDQTHEGSAEITVTETEVSTLYDKDEKFREIVNGLGYSWKDGRWRKAIGVTTGTAAERAAELGNKLLNAGFAVRIADEDIRAAAIEGRYEPQTYRWITLLNSGDHAGTLFVRWGAKDDLYDKAKKLRGASYVKPGIAVPVSEYATVEDFADIYGFRFSPGARKAIDAAKAATIVVAPAAAREAVYTEHPTADILRSGSDVLEDLRDDA